MLPLRLLPYAVIFVLSAAVLQLWQARPPAVTAIQPIPLDTAYRAVHAAEVRSLQGKIDSLTTLAKVVRTYPTKKLDSIVKIKSVIKEDTLRCVDEATYRDLVINSLHFGEQKYSLCLNQLDLKDSIEVSYQRDLDLTLHKYEEVSLNLASVERRKYHWLIGGLLVGIGVSLAVMYAN